MKNISNSAALDTYWMPFTFNGRFKAARRIITREEIDRLTRILSDILEQTT